MEKKAAIKIAITGPESTGKSTMAKLLAGVFETKWVEEYARTYLMQINRKYHSEDVVHIALEQAKRESEIAEQTNQYLFCDTDMLVCKIWHDVVFGYSHPTIEELFLNQPYDLALLMNIDLPWEPDPFREHPHRREELLNLYETVLKESGRPFQRISGQGKTRLNNALNAINKWKHEQKQ